MDNDTQAKLQTLFVNYTKNLPKKIADLEAQWLDLSQHWDSKKIQEFHRLIHSLCGSAGTYGYSDLSKTTRQLEIYLKKNLNSTSLTTEDKEEISTLFENIKTVAASAVHDSKFTSPFTEKIEKKLIYFITQDEDLIQELYENLEEAGYNLKRILSILDLIPAIKENQPAVLIFDIQDLDIEKDGIQKLFEIQKQFSIPLICAAENTDLLTRLLAIRIGSSAFFSKPLDTFYLVKTINQLCDLRSDPYRILILDDSTSLAEYYALILREAGMVTYAITNPLLIIEALAQFQPDLILMDVYMPDCTGLELATLLRQETMYARIPIIFLSIEEDKFKQLSVLSLGGGDDFLTKPILPQHLITAVYSRAKRAEMLNSFMITDSLTGLLNHTNILLRLEIELARAERQKNQLAFIMIDIDNFKSINDIHGHLIGDKVLKKLSSLLIRKLRKVDSVGRYGGEEFAIIMPKTDIKNSLDICERLRDQFSQISFTHEGTEFSVTFSVGIATYPEYKDINSLVMAADQALYKAKNNGGNQSAY